MTTSPWLFLTIIPSIARKSFGREELNLQPVIPCRTTTDPDAIKAKRNVDICFFSF
jgi:hypothetical protein